MMLSLAIHRSSLSSVFRQTKIVLLFECLDYGFDVIALLEVIQHLYAVAKFFSCFRIYVILFAFPLTK